MMKPDIVLMTPFFGFGRVCFTFRTTFFFEGTAIEEVGVDVVTISGVANLCSNGTSMGSELGLGELATVVGRANLKTIK